MKRLVYTFATLFALSGAAWGYSGSSQITVARNMTPTSVAAGGSVSVALTASIGSVPATIRGLYLTEYVPAGFSVSNVAVTKNGTAITSRVKRESLATPSIYTGFTIERWVLETPTAWSENNPVDPMTTVVITYTLNVPGNATAKTYTLPGFSWVAMITSQGDAGDIYGYEEPAPAVTVTGGSGETPPGQIAIAAATASSVENAGMPASNAIDGNAATRWSSGASDAQWIMFDLAVQKNIKGVVLVWENASGKTYKIQGSNDAAFGGTPVELYNYTAAACGAKKDSLIISNAGTFRYVRMLGLTRCTAYGYSIFEARIYGGSGGSVGTPPTVVTAAAASPNTVTGITTSLTALGADDGGEAALKYTWSTTGTPPAAVTFSANGTNPAKNVTATFTKSGSYGFQVTIQDADNQAVLSSVNVTVNQALSSAVVAPASATVAPGATQQFIATARDQFGTALTSQPAFAYTVNGGGTISASGLFTAGATAGGPYTVTATASGKSATASVTVSNTPGFSVKINFQIASTVTPSGYTADIGALYADRGNGYTYGWNANNSANARERNSTKSPDKRYDTFIHMQKAPVANAVWEIAVPNGTYTVKIAAGDPGYIDSYHKIAAEGIVVADGQPTLTANWIEGTKTVAVSDGKLTVGNAAGANNNKIDFIEITKQ